MFWQREYVRENVAMTLNDTWLQDLPEFGLLGSLLIRISGTEVSGYGQAGGDWRILDKISKIVILGDGSYVIKSLTGKQVAALATLDQGVMPPSSWRNYAANVQYEYLLINFGRYLYDNQVGLDLAKFKNIQIQLTNTATAATFADLTVSVLGYYLRDAGAGQFGGFMRTEEWRKWLTVADETKYLELPTQYLLRRIALQAIADVDASYLSETGIANIMDDIELSLDTGQVRVFKGGIDDLIRENLWDLGRPLISAGSTYMSADKGIDMGLGYIYGRAFAIGSLDGAVAATLATIEASRTDTTQKPETYEGDHPIELMTLGMAPHGVALLHFDQDYSPATWLDPKARQTVKLNIHTRNAASAADGDAAVILDSLVVNP